MTDAAPIPEGTVTQYRRLPSLCLIQGAVVRELCSPDLGLPARTVTLIRAPEGH